MPSELMRVSNEFKKIVDDYRERQNKTSAEITFMISKILKKQ